VADQLITISLLTEDSAQEHLARALLHRISKELNLKTSISSSIEGGKGRVINELKGFQKAIEKQIIPGGAPDIIIVMHDTNCHNFNEVKNNLENYINKSIFPAFIIGCPDPHAERWFFSDLESFHLFFGISPSISQAKCEKDYYKNALKIEIHKAGWPIIQGGVEYAQDIIDHLDFSRVNKTDRSLDQFISDIRNTLKRFKVIKYHQND